MEVVKEASTTTAAASYNNNATAEDGASIIELSIEETNALRAQLGLKPLRLAAEVDIQEDHDGRTARSALHKPAENIGEQSTVQKRIEEAKLKRQVQKGMERFMTKAAEVEQKTSSSTSSTAEWANKMRMDQQRLQEKAQEEETSSSDVKFKEESSSSLDHLNVAHSLQELTATTSTHVNSLVHETILTLRDESILDYDEHGMALVGVRETSDNILENVNLADDRKARENLRKKRLLELGAGRAGGYAGWDDDEFDELGGISWNHTNGNHPTSSSTNADYENPSHNKVRRLVDLVQDPQTSLHSTSEDQPLFASKQSLQQQPSDVSSYISNRILSDYLTSDQVVQDTAKEEKRRKKLLEKEKKLFKKLKKQQEKKKHFRSTTDEEENDVEGTEKDFGGSATSHGQSNSIVDQLEATAVDTNQAHHRGGRTQATEGTAGERLGESIISNNRTKEDDIMSARRQKFEYALQKGNLRTKKAFHLHDQPQIEENQKPTPDEIVSSSSAPVFEEDDDAVLIAALSKAQRLKKLKEMQQQVSSSGVEAVNEMIIHSNDAVAHAATTALQPTENEDTSITNRSATQGGLTFEFNQTKEFSHTLRSTSYSTMTKRSKKSASLGASFTSKKVKAVDHDESASGKEGDNVDVTMEDVASMDFISSDGEGNDDEVGGFGSSANIKPLDRGLAGALSLLKATGDITGKHAGKEDMCGRAKDERTYEDYEPLNLKEVVKIDAKSATAKDMEFANREVKLDYRDEHGRLLTRKEAWRHLCYQFHGYSSSYKNEEKRMKQVAQERAERAKQNEMLERGTLGALKATQKATGKAFILHKKI